MDEKSTVSMDSSSGLSIAKLSPWGVPGKSNIKTIHFHAFNTFFPFT